MIERKFPVDATNGHIRRALQRDGYSENQILSYLRGWNLVKNRGKV